MESYRRRPPPGFEDLWAQANRENPDPDSLVPYPIQGFQQLVQRQKQQRSSIAAQTAQLEEVIGRLAAVEQDINNKRNQYSKCRQAQKTLSHRCVLRARAA